MALKKKKPDPARLAQIVAGARRDQDVRESGYREQALKLFPHVCARCGREFAGKTLRELTVHHKDSDHMNNPPDGSNWELLCLYCHDDAHGAYGNYTGSVSSGSQEPPLGFRAFEGLAGLIKPKDDEGDTK